MGRSNQTSSVTSFLGRSNQTSSVASVLDRSNQSISATSSSKDNPVKRVITLLQDMEDTLKEEMEKDKGLTGKMGCWCHEESWSKSLEIKDLEVQSAALTDKIDSLTAKIAELNSSITSLNAEVATETKSLAEATEVRDKQAAEFHDTHLDAIQALEAVRAALEVLSKHQGESEALPQVSASFLALGKKGIASDSFDDFLEQNGIHHVELQPPAHAARAAVALASSAVSQRQHSGAWAASEASLVKRALAAGTSYMRSHGHPMSHHSAYASQSSVVVGILKQMQKRMEADLAEDNATEVAQASAYAELEGDKKTQITQAYDQAEEKEEDHAKARLDLATAKADLKATTADLAAANKYAADLEAMCTQSKADFEERKTSRNDEITAVKEAIAILMKDEARDAYSASYSFFQLTASVRSKTAARKQAAAILREAAGNAGSPALAALATRVQLDSFTKVKAAIDEMVADLKRQQQDEVVFVDECKNKLQETLMLEKKTQDTKEDLEAKAQTLGDTEVKQKEELDATYERIKTLRVDLQGEAEQRQKENLEFQKTMSDHVTIEDTLKEALQRLTVFYDSMSALPQTGQRQAPPYPQMTYKPHEGANSVLEMIKKIIQDTVTLQSQSRAAEQQAQAEYEKMVVDVSEEVKLLEMAAVTKQKEIANTALELEVVNNDLEDTGKTLADTASLDASLHGECDFVMQNFDIRQDARAGEIEDLQSVKEILNGASWEREDEEDPED